MPDRRPTPDEYAPHQEQYVSLIQQPVLDVLRAQRDDLRRLTEIAEERAGFRYAPGKWTIRECIGHMSDAERIQAFRGLSIARGDTNDLPRWDPDRYAEASGSDSRTIGSLVDEMLLVREATLSLFERLPREAWSRLGSVGGKPLTVRATAYIAAGHAQRHLVVLYERYGVELPL